LFPKLASKASTNLGAQQGREVRGRVHTVLHDGWSGQRLHWSDVIIEQSSDLGLAPGGRGYDADWFREGPIDKKITPCSLGRKSRDKPVKYGKRRDRRRNRIEIMFGRSKDWRRVATRYDRSPMVFLSAIAHAATVTFY
jgi:hypothetical protein